MSSTAMHETKGDGWHRSQVWTLCIVYKYNKAKHSFQIGMRAACESRALCCDTFEKREAYAGWWNVMMRMFEILYENKAR
jgi:hypothetical protein